MLQEDNMEHRSSIRQQKQYEIVQAKEGCACFRVQLPGMGKEEAVKDQTAAEGCHCPRGFDEEDRTGNS
jgi:hypothetical protein